MKNKHFKKWVSDLVKTFIIVTFVLGIALGISTSYDLNITILAIILIVISFFFAGKYNESDMFIY